MGNREQLLDKFLNSNMTENEFFCLSKENLISLRNYLMLLKKKELEFFKIESSYLNMLKKYDKDIKSICYLNNKSIIVYYNMMPFVNIEKNNDGTFRFYSVGILKYSKNQNLIKEQFLERYKILNSLLPILDKIFSIGEQVYSNLSSKPKSVSELFELKGFGLPILSYNIGNSILYWNWSPERKRFEDSLNKYDGNAFLDKVMIKR